MKHIFTILSLTSPQTSKLVSNCQTTNQSNMFRTQGNTRRNNTYRRNGGRGGKPAQKRTPFCKVCYDAGKPKEVYTSHYVKDRPGPEGKVCCPYLLSLTCRYCHKTGHTPNHCPEVRAKENRRSQPERSSDTCEADGFQKVHTPKGRRPRRHDCNAPRRSRGPSKPRNEKVTPRNMFSALDFEESEEKEEFPTLNQSEECGSGVSKSPALKGWATMAAKPPVVKEEKPVVQPVYTAPIVQYKTLAEGGPSWADMMDEEEEEDEPLHMPMRSTTARGQPTVTRDAWYDTDEEDEYDYDEDERYSFTSMYGDEDW